MTDNETLARIGSTCLQQFIENNVSKIDENFWEKICRMFIDLFEDTTPYALFFDYRPQAPQPPPGVVAPPEYDLTTQTNRTQSIKSPSLISIDPVDSAFSPNSLKVTSPVEIESPLQVSIENYVPDITGRPRPERKDFPAIISKCVLHLLVIQTLQEVLDSGIDKKAVYNALSSKHLFVLLDCLEKSYRFSKAFNEEMELRMALYRMGFMKQLPNLLKQETSSVLIYLSILIRMYLDEKDERVCIREEIERRFLP